MIISPRFSAYFSPIALLSIAVLLISALAACSSSADTTDEGPQDGGPSEPHFPSVPDPAHNARNALDYEGIYEAVLPCADCEGIETRIELFPEQQYRLETRYTGESEEVFISEGRFTWNEAGSTITLENVAAEERPNQYFVAENRLIQLDKDGERITGELADAYELPKQDIARGGRNVPLPHQERFVLMALDGPDIKLPESPERQPDLHFDTEEGRIYGTAGCNNFNAGYEAEGSGELAFSPIAATKMMCENMELEENYLAALDDVKAYEYDPQIQEILLLNDAGIIVARLRHEDRL